MQDQPGYQVAMETSFTGLTHKGLDKEYSPVKGVTSTNLK